jgi:peptidoglycan/LPS O-acetylase OafA/YrhL
MKSITTSERRHDLDWLRFIAIVILLFYHTGMFFVPWDWHVKNNELSGSFRYWMIWLHEWRMPLLLFISGAGTYMALGKRTQRQFAGERWKRLFIPLVFGMFVIVPPQIYFERASDYVSYWDFYKTVFEFVPYPNGSLSWHHLWFILYLLLFSMLALPLLVYLRSSRSDSFKERLSRMFNNPFSILLIPMIFIVISQVTLRPYFPDETHALIDDWAYFTYNFCFFIFGMVSYSNRTLWESFGRNRKALLFMAVTILIPYYVCFLSFREFVQLPWQPDTVEIIFEVTGTFVAWFWIAAVIAYGQHYLNRPHAMLKHVNEGLYPFYILHQTVIIAIGYYISNLSWGIFAKFWFISLLTLLICMLIYFLLIRPFNIIRILFGMKWIKRSEKRSVDDIRQEDIKVYTIKS